MNNIRREIRKMNVFPPTRRLSLSISQISDFPPKLMVVFQTFTMIFSPHNIFEKVLFGQLLTICIEFAHLKK